MTENKAGKARRPLVARTLDGNGRRHAMNGGLHSGPNVSGALGDLSLSKRDLTVSSSLGLNCLNGRAPMTKIIGN